MHKTGDVIRIDSSDSKGSPSSFNPSPDTGRWIFTLGQGVPSYQMQVVDREQRIVYRSGSSFATPIAAAIAAIILGVVDHADVSKYEGLATLRPRLRTRLGMEKVLCETCVQNAGSKRLEYYYLTPWSFFEDSEQTQIHVILRTLRHVPP
ncbi:hypothetical protein H0G86_002682 [Trichoderma simmonsii]|uniref:Peptidase S8/S53 domain-containing protein n=1 Tax=Trichoderma simmonsii TaxID=1491479 RepID=A0A8G0L970_9HYPO|nr:hypothetical protein H0G86_002682 [Trichoderma simmonsii]